MLIDALLLFLIHKKCLKVVADTVAIELAMSRMQSEHSAI